MKKLILLLFLPLWVLAQTSTGQEQEFDYGIKNNAAQTVTSPTYLTTTGTDGTQGKVVSVMNQNANSGILVGGGLSINADPTKYDIAFGDGYVSDPLNGTVIKVSWGTQTALTTPYRTTAPATYVLMANSGGFGTVITQSTPPTAAQYRTHIYLGKLAHTTLANILFAVSEPSRMFNTAGDLQDIARFIGSGNVDGNVINYNGSNLNINCSSGHTLRWGANFSSDRNSPNITTEPTFTAGTFRNKFRNGSGGWTAVNTSVIDPNYYDDGTGILAVVPNNKWTVKVFWRFGGTGTIHCDYGQAVYDTKEAALASIDKANVTYDPDNVRDASKRGWLVVKQGTTALNASVNEFIIADKFGQRTNSTTPANLQAVYDNSVTPQITTTTGGGAVAIKRGSAADTDNVLVVQNGAGSDTFTVNGNGAVSVPGNLSGTTGNFSSTLQAASFNIPGGTSSQFLKANGTVDSNSYALNSSLSSYVALTGNQSIAGNKTFTGQTAITNSSGGDGILLTNSSTGRGIRLNSVTGSTTDVLQFMRNGTETGKIDYLGNITAPSFIKSGANSTNILLAGGSDIAQSTFATATGGTGYIQNQNSSAQSANMWISGTVSLGNDIQYKPNGVLRALVNADLTSGDLSTYQYDNTGGFLRTAFTLTNSTGAATFASTVTASNGTLIGGTLTSGYIPKATGANSLGNSLIYDNGTNIGIGTASPSHFLTILGSDSTLPSLGSNGGKFGLLNGTGGGQYGLLAGVLNNGNAYQQVQRVDGTATAYNLLLQPNGGNVGIGTTNPINKFVVSNSGVNGIEIAPDPTASNGSAIVSFDRGSSLYRPMEYGASKHSFTNGNVLIGTTTDDGVNKLQVNGGITTNASSGIKFTNGSTWNINTDATTFNISETNIATRFTINKTSGVLNIPNLSGTGTRMVTADASGNLSTQTIPSSTEPYLVYTALISQSGTSAPTATVLRNTLGGTVVWSRTATGQYLATLTGAFTSGKTTSTISVGSNTGNNVMSFKTYRGSNNEVRLETYQTSSTAGVGQAVDSVLLDSTIEIRVYP